MEISYLQEFITLAQTGNFLDAADLLSSSQSTLSKHLKSLETELGVPLFDRTTRKVSITKYGQLLLPCAREILALQDQYTAVLKSSLETDRDVLNVGSLPALAEYKITDVLVNFKKIHPRSTINVMQGGAAELKEMLRLRKCELAFIRYANDMDDDLVKIPYAVDTMVAVLPATHSLAKKKSISLQLLANEDFVLSERQTMLYNLSISACKKCGFEPRVTYTDHKHENILDFVIKGMGVALMMKQLALYLSSQKIAVVDISPCVPTQIYLCHLKGMELSDVAKQFILCAMSPKNHVTAS
jgi:LysR family transcriptional regulator, transcription activator of glutamate synthase operon